MSASEKISSKASKKLTERIYHHSVQNPEAEFYYLEDEAEAAELLLEMAATMKVMARDVHVKEDRQHITNLASQYRHAVQHGQALATIRAMNDPDNDTEQLEIFGLKLAVRRILLS